MRRLLYPEAQHDRRITARVSRQIHLLRAHGLVRKVAKTYRYMVTAKGARSIAAILAAHDASTEELLQFAA